MWWKTLKRGLASSPQAEHSLSCLMSVWMALVAALNTLGDAEWSNMAAISCL